MYICKDTICVQINLYVYVNKRYVHVPLCLVSEKPKKVLFNFSSAYVSASDFSFELNFDFESSHMTMFLLLNFACLKLKDLLNQY